MKRLYTPILALGCAALLASSLVACRDVVVEENKAYRSAGSNEDEEVSGTSGNVYDFSNFSEIEANGASKVVLTQDSVFKVTIVGDKGVERFMEITQTGNRLVVDEKSDWLDRLDRGKCEVHISLPVLTAYHLSGANSTVMTNTFKQSETITLDMSGAGSFDLKVEVPEINIDASGASNVKLQGKTGTLNIDMSGAGNIEGDQLEANVANVESSGAGSLLLWVNEHLKVDASGVGAVRYRGNPTVIKEVSGMAVVKKVE
ncbi:MAG: hypothetical protein BGO31_02550 [Bacteroidetes bacterium 43-16]|nr:MAG: hypothetical protein BGO31_02550 [Bacteroidetes bacterium 43-16]